MKSAGGMSTSAGGAGAGGTSTSAGGAGGMSSNLVSNGTFDTSYSPWWKYANNTDTDPADITLAVESGQLCGTMTAGGKNLWDVIIGLSDVPLLKDQYYHISFSISADTDRKVKFKTGFGDKPYTDYFLEQIPISATPQTIEYTYLNLRDDPKAQFQFQI